MWVCFVYSFDNSYDEAQNTKMKKRLVPSTHGIGVYIVFIEISKQQCKENKTNIWLRGRRNSYQERLGQCSYVLILNIFYLIVLTYESFWPYRIANASNWAGVLQDDVVRTERWNNPVRVIPKNIVEALQRRPTGDVTKRQERAAHRFQQEAICLI